MGEQKKVKFLLIGGGAAVANAAVGIREVDADGSALIVCKEKWFPYDRPPLSKGFLTKDLDPTDVESKDPSFYTEKNIEVLRSTEAKSVDVGGKNVTLSDGSVVEYEKLLIATGATPNIPKMPGADLKGVHLLRTVDDSMAIKSDLVAGKAAVMVGAGYIGMEVGSGCIKSGMHVTIVDPSAHPWSKFASNETGGFLQRYYEKQGATMLMGEQVESIHGEDRVTHVKTKSGQEIKADMVVVGLGVSLNLALAKEAGLKMDDNGGVVADEFMRSSDANVYVAGDIAAFNDLVLGKRWHAEHYLNAQWTGKQAGRNMAGANEKYEKVPYFFSDMLDIGMVLRGDPQGGKSAKVFGDMDGVEFVDLYERPDGSLAMGMGFSRDGKKQDAYSEKLEELVMSRAKVADISAIDFGL
jgi:3-phenylpropionate/trans-cinnamate dioxygenase ferredoxin reductase subunit